MLINKFAYLKLPDKTIKADLLRSLLLFIMLFAVSGFASGQSSVKDIDGNVYAAVKIGNKTWMSENLKTTKLNDGTPITLVTDNKKWSQLTSPAYCWLNNDQSNKENSGALYNWYTVNTRKLCPKGWHVSTKEEWNNLISVAGGAANGGAKLKEEGIEHWKNNMIISTDEFGFTAIPGGLRATEGDFPEFAASYAVWWTATENNQKDAWTQGLFFSSSKVYGGNDNKKNGFSVRCIKD